MINFKIKVTTSGTIRPISEVASTKFYEELKMLKAVKVSESARQAVKAYYGDKYYTNQADSTWGLMLEKIEATIEKTRKWNMANNNQIVLKLVQIFNQEQDKNNETEGE